MALVTHNVCKDTSRITQCPLHRASPEGSGTAIWLEPQKKKKRLEMKWILNIQIMLQVLFSNRMPSLLIVVKDRGLYSWKLLWYSWSFERACHDRMLNWIHSPNKMPTSSHKNHRCNYKEKEPWDGAVKQKNEWFTSLIWWSWESIWVLSMILIVTCLLPT